VCGGGGFRDWRGLGGVNGGGGRGLRSVGVDKGGVGPGGGGYTRVAGGTKGGWWDQGWLVGPRVWLLPVGAAS
jgi:hypothetical protein